MNIDQRQRARRAADRRRPLYRGAMWTCCGAACFMAWAAGRFAQTGLVFPAMMTVTVVAILGAYALHFDGESRRTY